MTTLNLILNIVQGSTLTLILAEEEDAGVYQCRFIIEERHKLDYRIFQLWLSHENLFQDQLGEERGDSGTQSAHWVGAPGLVRGRRYDPHMQHIQTCAGCVEMGGEAAIKPSSWILSGFI